LRTILPSEIAAVAGPVDPIIHRRGAVIFRHRIAPFEIGASRRGLQARDARRMIVRR
jgi:hypothetical protein